MRWVLQNIARCVGPRVREDLMTVSYQFGEYRAA